MNRNFIVVLVLVVAGMIGLFVLSGSDDENQGSAGQIDNPRVAQEDDYTLGPENAPVTLIEYGDFGCPGCGGLATQIFEPFKQDPLSEEVKIIFRHFPLIQLHPNAMIAHRAAAAAAEQGKFWEMHDILYARQVEWTSRTATQQQAVGIIEGYANELELDIEKFNEDKASNLVFDFIDKHQKSGAELGLTGTPSLLLNGEEIATPRTYEEFVATIQAALAGDQAEVSDDEQSSDEPAATLPEEQDDEAADSDQPEDQ